VPPSNPNNLTQFRIKKDMRVAPIVRVNVPAESIQSLDKHLSLADGGKACGQLYLVSAS